MLDSKLTEVEGIRVHYWEGGSGFPVLMLHSVGPGTSIQGNYGPVLEPLADDVASLGLDMLLAEEGWKRGGQNPFLLGY